MDSLLVDPREVDPLLVDRLEIDRLTEALNLVSASEQRTYGWIEEGVHAVAYPDPGYCLPIHQLKPFHAGSPEHLVLYCVLKMTF